MLKNLIRQGESKTLERNRLNLSFVEDTSGEATINVAVYDSRIDVVAPGGLPKTMTIEEIFAGRSEIRNKCLARICREAGLIEAWGSGIVRMVEICSAAGLDKPVIREDGLFVCLSLPRRIYAG